MTATMENLIGLVNRIQRAFTVLGNHGGEGGSLWEALPSVAVAGGLILNLIPRVSEGEQFEEALARVHHCVGVAQKLENADSDSDLEIVT